MSNDFLQGYPVLEPGQTFPFACHPGIDCFNRCCADLDLVLSPYDALRLRKALKISALEFLERHAMVGVPPGNGPPQVLLKMNEDENKTCPFVIEQGCSIYPDRPSACRAYPVGRGASLDEQGNVNCRYILVCEPHCHGHQQTRTWTAEEWTKDQGLEEYNTCNDRYLRLTTAWRKTGRPLTQKEFGQVLNDLYQADDLEAAFQKVESYLLSPK